MWCWVSEMGVIGCAIGRNDPHGHAPDPLEILNLIAGLDEFNRAWQALGSKLSDREVERLLSNLEIKSFATRDEQEVAGYAEMMELLFQSWREITLTENHVKQLHRDLLQYSEKDAHHRGKILIFPVLAKTPMKGTQRDEPYLH
jgi:hypothetical protein